MYELMQHLVAFKYACKINHWSTNKYADHLLFDRLAERIDDWVDNIAEGYFMAHNDKKVFKPNLLNPTMVERDLVTMCEKIINHIEEILTDDTLDTGTQSLLGDIEADMLGKIALAQLQ